MQVLPPTSAQNNKLLLQEMGASLTTTKYREPTEENRDKKDRRMRRDSFTVTDNGRDSEEDKGEKKIT